MFGDGFTLGAIVLWLVTVVAVSIYFYLIRKVRREYEEARTVVGDIIMSFNRELEKDREFVREVAYRAETLTLREESLSKGLERLEGQLSRITKELKNLLKEREELSSRIAEVEKKIDELAGAQKDILERVEKMEGEGPSIQAAETLPMGIPIKRERVLSSLTETEMKVLEILAREGEKRAPEIRDRIKLSREHTARLMKKLYEQGYLERDTSKIPYTYRLKKEMLELLKDMGTGVED